MTACTQDFQMLAVLSGSDQLTGAEEATLAAHAASCVHCQQIVAEVSALAPHLTLATHARPQLPKGHEARFIARATRYGLPLRVRTRELPPYALQLASLAMLLVCAATWSWTTRSSIKPAPQTAQASTPRPAMEVETEQSHATVRVRSVHRPRPTVPHHPLMLSASFRFTWPQQTATGVERQPVFTRDLRQEFSLVTKPTFVSQEVGSNHLVQASSFPFKVDMASLILQEPPKIHLGEVAISDLSFIPSSSIHP